MPITIQLSYQEIDDPFVEFPWEIDFAAGGVPDMVFTNETTDPVIIYQHFEYSTRFWEVQFDSPVAWSSIEGRNAAALIADGATVLGSLDNDLLRMTDFAENVFGGEGDDSIFGRGGKDHLIGGDGNDQLFGGEGRDTLTGGDPDGVTSEDHEYFAFVTPPSRNSLDHITDMKPRSAGDTTNGDVIMFNIEAFPRLEQGMNKALRKTYFEPAKAADDRNDHILYDRGKGALYYDRDGSRDKHDPVKFAILDNRPKLSSHDFGVYDAFP